VSSSYTEIAVAIAKLTEEKQLAYGNSFEHSGKILAILYPSGVDPEHFVDLLAIARVVDKLFRIATDPNYGGESPWRDIAGYALLGAARAEADNV
jgi:hypothetical protein